MQRDPRLSKSALAAEAWRLLFRFFISTRAQRDRVLGHHDVTPNDMRALTSLDDGEGRSMRSLAEEWGCDASNVTWMVDRLEKRALAVRTTPASDRRLKRVRLTALGKKKRDHVVRELNEPPPELLALDVERLKALRDALTGLPEPPAGVEHGRVAEMQAGTRIDRGGLKQAGPSPRLNSRKR
jgi:DNA-binding MarR family transcriptional regulator